MSFALSAQGISKRFGALSALDQVDLHVRPGSIHGVVGENGAGKTTLMRIFYGAIQPDEGVIEVDGEPVRFASSREAIAAGIGMVSQNYGIIPQLTCLQNLILGAEPGPFIHRRELVRRADSLAGKLGFQFDWNRPAEGLGPGAVQKLEILKLLWRNARIMILDEPTAMLSPADGAALFDNLKRLTAEGATVLLVTHRLPEVLDFCSEVTVLRGGKRIAEKPIEQTDARDLAQLIVGQAVSKPYRARTRGAEVLRLDGVSVRGKRGAEVLNDVSLALFAGEIVGVAGVDGNGQRELLQTLLGLIRPAKGTVRLKSSDITRSAPSSRIAAGMRLIPEDRHLEGLVESWPLEENAALGLQREPPFARRGFIQGKQRREAATAMAERFTTRFGSIRSLVSSLSGGNQQRFVAGRALFGQPSLLLAFQPTRGLDLAGTAQVYEGIREATRSGAAALIVSFDLDELLEYCDRVIVMNRGLVLDPPAGGELDRDVVGRLMVGAS